MMMTRPANMRPKSVLYWAWMLTEARPRGSVFFSGEFTNTSAKRYSFQMPRKLKMAAVTRPGRASGSIIWRNTVHSEAPSMIADSRSALGSDLKKPVRIRMVKGRLSAM